MVNDKKFHFHKRHRRRGADSIIMEQEMVGQWSYMVSKKVAWFDNEEFVLQENGWVRSRRNPEKMRRP